jgi:hypothetical protein
MEMFFSVENGVGSIGEIHANSFAVKYPFQSSREIRAYDAPLGFGWNRFHVVPI